MACSFSDNLLLFTNDVLPLLDVLSAMGSSSDDVKPESSCPDLAIAAAEVKPVDFFATGGLNVDRAVLGGIEAPVGDQDRENGRRGRKNGSEMDHQVPK